MLEIFIVDAESSEGVEQQLKSAKAKMLKNLNDFSTRPRSEVDAHINPVRKDPTSFAVIINGHSLVRNFGCWGNFA